MVVIDMDMPISCADCPICNPKGKDEPWNYACYQGMMDINLDEWDEKRHPNCPIKCDIDDIKAEIQEHTRRYTLARESGGMGQVVWSDYLIKADDVIKIIDKHTQ